jgi:hypothetical protein
LITPAMLAVAYPHWIRYNGCCDPRFVDRAAQFSHFWAEGLKEAEVLHQKYESVSVFSCQGRTSMKN